MDGTIYTDPYSGTEVLLLRAPDHLFGVAYNPRSTTDPVPWHSGCHHCLIKGPKDLSIHTKREIQTLRTLDDGPDCMTCRVPSNSHDFLVTIRGQKIIASQAEIGVYRNAMIREKVAGKPATIVWDKPHQKAQLLCRIVKFLLSARPIGSNEIRACTTPLANRQTQRGIQGHRNQCMKIDWCALLREV